MATKQDIKQARAFMKQWLTRLHKQPFVCQHAFSSTAPVNGRNKVVGCALSCAIPYKEMAKCAKKDRVSDSVYKKLKKVFGKLDPEMVYDIDHQIPAVIDNAKSNVLLYNEKEGGYAKGLSGPRAAALTKRELRHIFKMYLPKNITKELLA